MAVYVFANDGLTIFDATGAVITLNSTGQPVDHIRNVVNIKNAGGLKNYGASPQRATSQTAMPMQVTALIYFITYQSVRTTQSPTTTSKFSRTPGCINLKIINCKTEAVNTLCKQATSSLYSDSEGKLSLKSEVLLPLL